MTETRGSTTTVRRTPRILWVDAARGVAIILVILHHSIQWASSAGYGSEVWLSLTNALATMRLPLFFAISGMLAAKWMNRSWRELLASKVATLVWLYLIWQAVTFLSYLVIPNVSTPGKSDLRELLTFLATPVLPQNSLWFIWALALFFIACRWLTNKVPGWAVIAAAAIPSTLCFAGLFDAGNVGWSGALDNFVFFALGVFGPRMISGIGQAMNVATALLAVGGWVAFLLLVPAPELVGLNLVSRGLGLLAGIGFGVLLQHVAPLRRAGKDTLTFYLPHFVILGALAFGASALHVPASAEIWLPAAFLLATCAVCMVLRRTGAGFAYGLPAPVTRALSPRKGQDR